MQKKGLEWVWEKSISFMYNGEYVKSLDSLFREHGVKKILDASCGIGFPSIRLSKFGYNITCTDGSEEMLRRFRKNCVKEGVRLESARLKWQDLSRHFSEEFDCVMCRGNSLPYVISWNGKADISNASAEIEISIKNFYRVLRKGGVLYLDIHTREALTPERTVITEDFGEKKINGIKTSMRWKIRHDLVNSKRTWEPCIIMKRGNATEEIKAVVDGYHIKHHELLEFVRKAGFSRIEAYKHFRGEENYDVFLAFK
jgi:SAM-dependent methyltransferase